MGIFVYSRISAFTALHLHCDAVVIMHLRAATKGNVVEVVIQLQPQDRSCRFTFVQVVFKVRQPICELIIGKHYF